MTPEEVLNAKIPEGPYKREMVTMQDSIRDAVEQDYYSEKVEWSKSKIAAFTALYLLAQSPLNHICTFGDIAVTIMGAHDEERQRVLKIIADMEKEEVASHPTHDPFFGIAHYIKAGKATLRELRRRIEVKP
jgi:hypothetical protein